MADDVSCEYRKGKVVPFVTSHLRHRTENGCSQWFRSIAKVVTKETGRLIDGYRGVGIRKYTATKRSFTVGLGSTICALD